MTWESLETQILEEFVASQYVVGLQRPRRREPPAYDDLDRHVWRRKHEARKRDPERQDRYAAGQRERNRRYKAKLSEKRAAKRAGRTCAVCGVHVHAVTNAKRYCSLRCNRAALRRSQAPKKRRARKGLPVTVGTESLSLQEWSRRQGIPYRTVYMRIKRGWSIEEALGLRTISAARTRNANHNRKGR